MGNDLCVSFVSDLLYGWNKTISRANKESATTRNTKTMQPIR